MVSGCFDVHSESNIRASKKIEEEVNEEKWWIWLDSKMHEEKDVEEDVSEPYLHDSYSKEYGKQFKKR